MRSAREQKHAAALSIGLALSLGLCGCRAIQVKLGIKVPLASIQVNSIEASLPKNPAIAPGQKSPLVVTFTGANGKSWTTEGAGHGKIMWSDLAVTPSVVTVNKKGVISLARDPRKSDGKTGHVNITAPSHPGLQADLDIPLRYNVKFTANFNGDAGMNGTDGSSGLDGSSGSDGSTDATNPSSGGNGSDGGDGTDGGDGQPGGDAPSVQLWLTVQPGAHPLLEAGVLAAGHKEHYYLIDPKGGSLTVSADGGDGGQGGKGGSGGRGGSGGSGIPPGMNGNDGRSGMDGTSGSMGSGGLITVTYDSSAQAFLSTVRLSSAGGPKPQFSEQPVAPLW
jgi:hypothetical protein